VNLPEDDDAFLRGKGYDWSLIPDGDGGLLVIKNYAVDADKYDRAATDLMIRIPAKYNLAKLDMWYVDPPLRVKGTNQFPQQAATFETHGGRSWQRFSRHLPDGAWRAGVDGLAVFFTFINAEFK
jgi:hypothetical protein